jgi:FAD/FMN-containing dehydrogenase
MTATRIEQFGLAASADDLSAHMQGRVVTAGDVAYSDVRRIWNGAVTHEPALFALCETTEGVQAAVRIARSHNLPLSVRGGGHDWAGRALSDASIPTTSFRRRYRCRSADTNEPSLLLTRCLCRP